MENVQTGFRAALLDPDQPAPPGLTDGKGRPARKRFDVYRNNVTVALCDALGAAFPVLAKLLGPGTFAQLAEIFVRAHPPKSPLMMHYGADLPGFLDQFQPLAHVGYLSDVARLELALRRSYHARDAAPIDPARLGAVPPETLMAATLTLAPAVELIPSRWPLFDIWRFNMIDGAPKPRAIAQPVLITRVEYDPEPHPLTQDQAAWITAIQSGAPFGAAQDAAGAIRTDFDLSPLLTLLITQGALIDFTTPKD